MPRSEISDAAEKFQGPAYVLAVLSGVSVVVFAMSFVVKSCALAPPDPQAPCQESVEKVYGNYDEKCSPGATLSTININGTDYIKCTCPGGTVEQPTPKQANPAPVEPTKPVEPKPAPATSAAPEQPAE